jgi:hypothetical protein
MMKLSSIDKAKALAKSKTVVPAGGTLALIAVVTISVASAIGVGLYARSLDKKSRRRFNYV